VFQSEKNKKQNQKNKNKKITKTHKNKKKRGWISLFLFLSQEAE
jgi:hypothetical protein